MAIDRGLYVEELRKWKDALEMGEDIPLSAKHTYKNENDIYERLMQYTKEWVESMFGYTTNNAGEFVELPDEYELKEGENEWDEHPEKSELSKGWVHAGGKDMTALSTDWFDVALKGAKKGNNPLPRIKREVLQDENAKTIYNDARSDVVSTFFPAYRALKESYAKRPWYQWIFNHRQYVAERDALKVMTNLIKSMTGYSDGQLETQYNRHCASITPEEVKEYVPAQRHEEELFSDVERIDQEIVVDGKVIKVDPIENAERIDTWDFSKEQEKQEVPAVSVEEKQEVPAVSVEETVVQPTEVKKEEPPKEEAIPYVSAHEKLNAINGNKDKVIEIRRYFVGEITNATANESAMYHSTTKHLYEPLFKYAQTYCSMFDACSLSQYSKAEDKTNLAKTAAKNMFETAFTGLGAVGERTITKMVDGKKVEETLKEPAFGIKTLKDHIIAAQNIADIMLQATTPVGFNKKEYKQYGKGYQILENTEMVREFLKTACNGKYTDREIDRELQAARNEFGVLYRGEQYDVSHVYDLDYRPNPKNLQAEFLALGQIQRTTMKNKLTGKKEDLAAWTINNANIKKWKAMDKAVKAGQFDAKTFEAFCKDLEGQAKDLYPDYDSEKVKVTVTADMEERAKRKAAASSQKIQVDLNEPKAQVVPPVASKPAEKPVPKK